MEEEKFEVIDLTQPKVERIEFMDFLLQMAKEQKKDIELQDVIDFVDKHREIVKDRDDEMNKLKNQEEIVHENDISKHMNNSPAQQSVVLPNICLDKIDYNPDSKPREI